MTRSLFSLIAFGLASVMIAGCAESQRAEERSSADAISAARAQLIDALDRCEATHGYDLSATAAISENALAPSEPAWRQCAYDALRAYDSPDPRVRQQIESLIVEDIAMTAAIRQGTTTRSERKARNLQQIDAIKALEEVEIRTAAAAQAQHEAQVRQVVGGLRGFAR